MLSLPDVMQAVLAEAKKEPLRLVQVPRPQAGAGEVLVRVMASAVNPLDTKILAGTADHARQTLPAILGIDMAGVVVAVGKDTTKFREGDAVYGMAGGVGGHPGSLAEYMAVDARLLAGKPANLTMREAAAAPLVFITAWEGLVDRAAVRAGQHVLVQGGAGGVGQMVLQIARARGATTSATGSAAARAAIERLGAQYVDRAEPAADIVFDTAGGASLDASFVMVRRFGHVVSALGWGDAFVGAALVPSRELLRVFTLLPLLTGEGRERHGAILVEATKLAEVGQFVPVLDPRRFTLATVGDAYRAIETGS
jgi:NADPH2:quinone reductase